MLGKALRRTSAVLGLPAYILGLRRATAQGNKIQDWIDVAYHFRFRSLGIAPAMLPAELAALLAAVSKVRVERMLEIGTGDGGALYLFCRVVAPQASIISVDSHLAYSKIPLFRSFAQRSQRMEFIRADSRERRTLARVVRALGDRSLDFLFIDGDHSYEGVKSDYETYSPLVRPGGLIALHPICPGPPQTVGGVPRFWSELGRGRSFIQDPTRGGFGIGLIEVEG